MTKHTKRDRIWSAALTLALEWWPPVRVDSVRERADLDESSDRTIRDVLNTMVSERWLTKETEQAHRWRRGPKIRYLGVCETCGDIGHLRSVVDDAGDREYLCASHARTAELVRDR